MQFFVDKIKLMNKTYELESISNVMQMAQRIDNFKVILGKEFKELDDIINDMNAALSSDQTQDFDQLFIRFIVAMADLLGDITVYCFSEAERYNIPMAEVLTAIMDSNFTKLGADGKPIKDENGKFLKGPNFRPPEPAIENIIRAARGLPTLALNYDPIPESPVPDQA